MNSKDPRLSFRNIWFLRTGLIVFAAIIANIIGLDVKEVVSGVMVGLLICILSENIWKQKELIMITTALSLAMLVYCVPSIIYILFFEEKREREKNNARDI